MWKYLQADFVKASELIGETDWDQLFSCKSLNEVCLIWQETFILMRWIKGALPKRRNVSWASQISDTLSSKETVLTNVTNEQVTLCLAKQLRNRPIRLTNSFTAISIPPFHHSLMKRIQSLPSLFPALEICCAQRRGLGPLTTARYIQIKWL